MSGRILQAMMMVLTCYVPGQKHGAVSADADSSDQANRLQNLEAQLQKQDEINNQQAEAIAEQAAFMAGQANQLEKQADQLEKQAAINGHQADQLEKQADQLERQASINVQQANQLENQAASIAVQSARIADLEQENQHQHDNIVAFTASASQTRSYNQGDRVLFDSVLTNYGDSYDSLTSSFTCSVSGYYLFSVSVRTDGDNEMHAQIQLDDTPLVAAYAIGWNVGTSLVVTLCAEGQAVWVMCHYGQGRVMIEEGDRYSTFSGTLLTLA